MAVKIAAHHFLKIRRALHLQLKLNHHHLQFIHFTFCTHKMESVIEIAAEAAEAAQLSPMHEILSGIIMEQKAHPALDCLSTACAGAAAQNLAQVRPQPDDGNPRGSRLLCLGLLIRF